MIVYALTYQVGLEHGFEKLIGIYTSEELATKAKEDFKQRHRGLERAYFYIEEIPVNEEVLIDLASW